MLTPLHPAAEYAAGAALVPPLPGQTGPLLLKLLEAVDQTFERAPAVLRPAGSGRVLLLLYRDVSCLWEDLTGPWGEAAATISRVWPAAFYSMAPTGETGELKLERTGERVTARLRTVSGRPFRELEGLCLRLEAGSREDCGALSDLCAAFGGAGWSAALDRRYEDFLRRWGLLRPVDGSLFCYLEGGGPAEELAWALSARRQEQLWRTFLQDGVQPVEFQWLWDAYRRGRARYLLEWALTLEAVLESMGVPAEAGASWARRYDFVRGGPAEKLLLKLLFPVEYREEP